MVSAGGRIIAEKLVAPFDQPPFARSPLDGYAVRSSDIEGASREKPAKLTVIGEVMAGYEADTAVETGPAAFLGAEIVYAGQSSDNPEDVVEIFCKYQNQVDLIVTTGGVSVGKKDIMHDVFRMSDIERIFWRVDIKPGMPILAGDYMGIPVVALSGNPFGVVVTSQLFVRTALCKMTGDPRLEMKWRDAVLDNEYSKKSKARRFVRSKYADGYVRIVDGANGNGTLSTVCHCNCFLDIPAGSGALRAGEKVAVLMI